MKFLILAPACLFCASGTILLSTANKQFFSSIHGEGNPYEITLNRDDKLTSFDVPGIGNNDGNNFNLTKRFTTFHVHKYACNQSVDAFGAIQSDKMINGYGYLVNTSSIQSIKNVTVNFEVVYGTNIKDTSKEPGLELVYGTSLNEYTVSGGDAVSLSNGIAFDIPLSDIHYVKIQTTTSSSGYYFVQLNSINIQYNCS